MIPFQCKEMKDQLAESMHQTARRLLDGKPIDSEEKSQALFIGMLYSVLAKEWEQRLEAQRFEEVRQAVKDLYFEIRAKAAEYQGGKVHFLDATLQGLKKIIDFIDTGKME
jgi:hypothetical protein